MDVHSPEKRSANMSIIRAKNTKPEILVRKFLFSKGYRYRINCKELPGTPDIVLSGKKTVIFVNGCFWHCHENCSDFKYPKSNEFFWKKKLQGNKERDEKNMIKLGNAGWKVVIIWTCELKSKIREKTLNDLIKLL